MEESHSSRVSDAAATRKRRSSILKSQRVTRAPLSELEFHVATPTDTAKSRRVSFSRRTGVAEFVTNEATTTWKNFYEEHNKTLESSGNDSEANAPRPSVGHLGNRFNQQFSEEAIHFDTISNGPDTSITNIKLNGSECTENYKLSIPQQNFEFSTFTDHQSKFFGDDLGISGLGEVTDKINVNFSAMQAMGDDLDEMQMDFNQHSDENNFVYPGPRSDRNSSEYIQVDLNVTHAALKEETTDMSITDTIHSLENNVSKSNTSGHAKKMLDKDWGSDKENIVVNPYIAPKESATFALNDNSDKILVYDGKRLTIQSENEPLSDYRKTLLPNSSPERKLQYSTLVLNVDDDLPNFTDNIPGTLSFHSKSSNKTLIGNDMELSMTQPLMADIKTNLDPQRTFYQEDTGNISITEALPTNILQKEKRRTIVFDSDSADISVTQAVPSNILAEKSKTIVFDSTCADMSVTQAVPLNIMTENKEKRMTIVFEKDSDSADISVTQAVPSNILSANTEKRKTIVFDSDISVTQVIPSNILSANAEKRRTIVFDSDSADISVTQAVPVNILPGKRRDTNSTDGSVSQAILSNILTEGKEKRGTIVFKKDSADISVSHVVPSNTLTKYEEKRKTIVFDSDSADISVTQAIPTTNIIFTENHLGNKESTEKRKTIVYEDEDGNISITQALPSNVILPENDERNPVKRRTILYESDVGNISVTQAVSSALVLMENANKKLNKRQTIVFNEEAGNISITQAVPSNLVLTKKNDAVKRRTLTVFNNEEMSNISLTQAVPKNLILSDRSTFDNLNTTRKSLRNSEKFLEDMQDTVEQRNEQTQRVIAYDESADISVTQALPFNMMPEKRKSVAYDYIPVTPTNMTLSVTNHDKSGTMVYEKDGHTSLSTAATERCSDDLPNIKSDLADMSVTKAILTNIILPDKRKSTVNEIALDVSMTDAVAANILFESNCLTEKKMEIAKSSANSSTTTITQETASTESNEADISMTASDDVIEDTQTKEIPRISLQTTEIFSRSRNSIKPIPQDIITLQKDIMNDMKSLIDKSRLQDVVVYQTSAHADSKPNNPQYSISEGSSSATAGPTDSKKTIDSAQNALNDAPKVLQKPDLNLDFTSSTSNFVKSQTNTSEIGYGLINTPSAVNEIKSNIQNSILNDLLDMHEDPDGDGIEDKAVTAKVSQQSIRRGKCETDESSDSLFYITRDSNEDTEQTDNSDDGKNNIIKNPANHSLRTIKLPSSPSQVKLEHCIEDLEKKLLQVHQHSSDSRSPTRNHHFEKMLSSDLEALNSDFRGKTIKDADNTRDLLDMLSKFTDKEEQEDPIEPLKGRLSKTEILPSRRLSVAPRRQSVVLSREDMLNNISMAQALLQENCGTDPDSDQEMNNTSLQESPSQKRAVRMSPEVVKTLRFEDDDSVSEVSSAKCESVTSPLKKTAFGETSYMLDGQRRNDRQPKVIPTYLKDVSDGIKELMSDLVKPMADVLPFDNRGGYGGELKKNASTCSTQIQANLITSSQIDLDPETHSDPDSLISSGIKKLRGIIKPYLNASSDLATASEGSIDTEFKQGCDKAEEIERVSEKSSEIDFGKLSKRESYGKMAQLVANRLSESVADRAIDQSVPGPVITFDPTNPLNNVLIAPIDFNDAHTYHPQPSVPPLPPSSLRSPENSHVNTHAAVTFKDVNTEASERVASHYDVMMAIPTLHPQYDCSSPKENHCAIIPKFSTQSSEFNFKELSQDTYSSCEVRRQSSVDQAVETARTRMKDEEINTLIVMKDNVKLLEANSSLTLVDDNLHVGPYCGELDSGTSKDVSPSSSNPGCIGSRFNVIYEQHSNVPGIFESNTTCDEEFKRAGDQKRKHTDKHKNCTLSALDTTPKLASKIARRSLSPHIGCHHVSKHRSEGDHDEGLKKDTKIASNLTSKDSQSQRKSSKRKQSPKINRTGTNITVQQVSTEYQTSSEKDARLVEAIDKAIAQFKAGKILEREDSLPNPKSNDLKDMGDAQYLESDNAKEKSLQMDWQPELTTELGSKNLPNCEASVDVLAKIEKLSFMGNRECEWEVKCEDTWSFRLLLGRLLLSVQLARPAASRGHVRADTPVLGVTLEATSLGQFSDKKNAIAVLCIRFASEAMRYFINRGVTRAGDVPALLRRCAGVARVALRWGRAMYDAWRQLAYTLTCDGRLTLKVANVALRSVWEVSMSIELAADARARGRAAWPRAGDVTVARVVSDVAVTSQEVRRALARVRAGWGHAPTTLWKIFKYLKNKTRDDDLLLGI